MTSILTSSSVVIFILYFLVSSSGESERLPPSFKGIKTIDELAVIGGYYATNYEVITEDGYSLWLHRLGGNNGTPVLMQHGLLLSADSWVTRGPNDLAFRLLREGYDVWLANLRGTVYNEYSYRYNRSDPEFWNFSFHETAIYDLPAFIDTILQVRNVSKIIYIGHSLGTTVFLAMAASRPEYNDKVKLAVLLSPTITFDGKSGQRARILFTIFNFVATMSENFGIHVFGQRTNQTVNFFKTFCQSSSPNFGFCLDFVGILFGEHRNNINPEDWNSFVPYYLVGTSNKMLRHSFQIYISGHFRQFDYGPEKNLMNYGSKEPPNYDLKKVTAPVAIFWGAKDPLLDEVTIDKLRSILPKVLVSWKIEDTENTHLDTLIGDNNRRILYPVLIQILNSVTKDSLNQGLRDHN